MSRVLITTIAIVIYSFSPSFSIDKHHLERLVRLSDASGIEEIGFEYWRTDDDGYVGYHRFNYEDQIWVKPGSDLHFTSENNYSLSGRCSEDIEFELFEDGPMKVYFVSIEDLGTVKE